MYRNSRQTLKKISFEFELQTTTRQYNITWETFARSSVDVCKKEVLITGDFSVNFLDFENNDKVQSFVNMMFGCGMDSGITNPTRVTRYTATAIDHMFANSIIDYTDYTNSFIIIHKYWNKISYHKGRYFWSLSNTFCC